MAKHVVTPRRAISYHINEDESKKTSQKLLSLDDEEASMIAVYTLNLKSVLGNSKTRPVM